MFNNIVYYVWIFIATWFLILCFFVGTVNPFTVFRFLFYNTSFFSIKNISVLLFLTPNNCRNLVQPSFNNSTIDFSPNIMMGLNSITVCIFVLRKTVNSLSSVNTICVLRVTSSWRREELYLGCRWVWLDSVDIYMDLSKTHSFKSNSDLLRRLSTMKSCIFIDSLAYRFY